MLVGLYGTIYRLEGPRVLATWLRPSTPSIRTVVLLDLSLACYLDEPDSRSKATLPLVQPHRDSLRRKQSTSSRERYLIVLF